MSGFPTMRRERKTLQELGFTSAPAACIHRGLTDEMLALFLSEAQKHVDLLSYDELAKRSGLSRGTVNGLMAQMIREKREGIERKRIAGKSSELVARATQVNEVEGNASNDESISNHGAILAAGLLRDPGQ